jgi:hypothetical protein
LLGHFVVRPSSPVRVCAGGSLVLACSARAALAREALFELELDVAGWSIRAWSRE